MLIAEGHSPTNHDALEAQIEDYERYGGQPSQVLPERIKTPPYNLDNSSNSESVTVEEVDQVARDNAHRTRVARAISAPTVPSTNHREDNYGGYDDDDDDDDDDGGDGSGSGSAGEVGKDSNNGTGQESKPGPSGICTVPNCKYPMPRDMSNVDSSDSDGDILWRPPRKRKTTFPPTKPIDAPQARISLAATSMDISTYGSRKRLSQSHPKFDIIRDGLRHTRIRLYNSGGSMFPRVATAYKSRVVKNITFTAGPTSELKEFYANDMAGVVSHHAAPDTTKLTQVTPKFICFDNKTGYGRFAFQCSEHEDTLTLNMVLFYALMQQLLAQLHPLSGYRQWSRSLYSIIGPGRVAATPQAQVGGSTCTGTGCSKRTVPGAAAAEGPATRCRDTIHNGNPEQGITLNAYPFVQDGKWHLHIRVVGHPKGCSVYLDVYMKNHAYGGRCIRSYHLASNPEEKESQRVLQDGESISDGWHFRRHDHCPTTDFGWVGSFPFVEEDYDRLVRLNRWSRSFGNGAAVEGAIDRLGLESDGIVRFATPV